MNSLPYSSAAVANSFLELSASKKSLLTPMQLLKLVYIAHGWNLAITNRPLINEAVQAWKYGPVIPSLFHEFKQFGGSAITRTASYPVEPTGEGTDETIQVEHPFIDPDDSATHRLIRWVWTNYGHLTGPQLSGITHKPGTPWSITVDKMKRENPQTDWVSNCTIDNALIKNHYLDLWAKRNGTA